LFNWKAWEKDITIYDASYVALAEEQNAKLYTAYKEGKSRFCEAYF